MSDKKLATKLYDAMKESFAASTSIFEKILSPQPFASGEERWDFLKSHCLLLNPNDRRLWFPYMAFYVPHEKMLQIAEKYKKGFRTWKIWRSKLFADFEIDRKVEDGEWTEEYADAVRKNMALYKEYRAKEEAIPYKWRSKEYNKAVKELEAEYAEYLIDYSRDASAFDFNFWLGPAPCSCVDVWAFHYVAFQEFWEAVKRNEIDLNQIKTVADAMPYAKAFLRVRGNQDDFARFILFAANVVLDRPRQECDGYQYYEAFEITETEVKE